MADAVQRATVFSLHMLAYFSLRILHSFYSMLVAFSGLDIFGPKTPQPLSAKRKKIPSHLAVLLVSDDDLGISILEGIFIETVDNAVQWCRIVGIPTLTVYDNEGILMKCSRDIRQRVGLCHDSIGGQSSDSDIEYPLTPPLSDHSDSAESPSVEDLNVITIEIAEPSKQKTAKRKNVLKRRRLQRNDDHTLANPLTLHIASRESSKPAIASVARSLALTQSLRAAKTPVNLVADKFDLSINDLHSLLEGKRGLSSPDFMIVHRISPSKYNQTALEIHGFPPWQIRLTEFYHNRYRDRHPTWMNWLRLSDLTSHSTYMPLDQLTFRAALDEFAEAEMRLGR